MVTSASRTGIDGTRPLGDDDDLGADELSRHWRRAILKDQIDHLTEIRVEPLKCLGLAVGPRQPWYVANVETGVGAALQDGSVGGVSAGATTFRHGTDGTPDYR